MPLCRTRLIFLFLLASFFTVSHEADAALLYFDPGTAELHRGDSMTASLRIDTDEGECINTVDAVLSYDPNIKIVDVSRGDSILSLWVEEPTIDEQNHQIRFAGGLPGGYCGRIQGDPALTNVLVTLVLRSPGFSVGGASSPSATIAVAEGSQVLLHDGLGTPATLLTQDLTVGLLSSVGNAPLDPWTQEIENDTEAPSDFTVTLTKDDTAFSGKYFIVFNSIDKQSGIDHYEVMEEPFIEFYTFKWGRADAPWVVALSPYVLNDQTLNSTIRVKAIDKAGNERIATLVPDTALRSISRDRLLMLFVVGGFSIILIALVVYALWRRRQRVLRDEETMTS